MAFDPWIDSNQAFNDDGSESTATAIAAPETSVNLDTDITYHCRLQISDLGAGAGTLLGAKWMVEKVTPPVVTLPLTETSQYIKAVLTPNLVEGEHTTQRIGSPLLPFITPNGWVRETGGAVPDLLFGASQQCELLLSFQIVGADVAVNDNLIMYIDVVANGSPLDIFVATITNPPAVTRRIMVVT